MLSNILIISSYEFCIRLFFICQVNPQDEMNRNLMSMDSESVANEFKITPHMMMGDMMDEHMLNTPKLLLNGK